MAATKARDVKPLLKGLVMLAVLGGLVLVAKYCGLESRLSGQSEWFMAHVQGHGAEGVLLFVGVSGLASALGMPRQVLAFLGGYAYGWLWGGLLTTLGTLSSCALDFTLARTLGRDLVMGRFGHRVAKFDAFLRADPFRTALAIRLFPVGHNLSTSVIAGVTSIPAGAFLLGTALGYVPMNIIFALFGAGINAQSPTGKLLSIGLSLVLLVASSWLGVSIYRSYKRRGAVPVAEDDSPDADGQAS